MTITQAAAPTGTAVTIAGTVRTPLTLVRPPPARRRLLERANKAKRQSGMLATSMHHGRF